MKYIFLNRLSFFCTIVSVTSFGVLCMSPNARAITLEELQSGLPEQFMAWSREGDDKIYTPQTIYGYINGGG